MVLPIPVLNAQIEDVEVPKNGKLISQSCTTADSIILLIDMDNKGGDAATKKQEG